MNVPVIHVLMECVETQIMTLYVNVNLDTLERIVILVSHQIFSQSSTWGGKDECLMGLCINGSMY